MLRNTTCSQHGMFHLFILPFFLVGLLPAHGGQYRGPRDLTPPGNNPPGRSTKPGSPNPGNPTTAPKTGVPIGPSTGVPTGPAGRSPRGRPRASLTSKRGVQLDDDLTTWSFWWEFNKDPFIRLKSAIHNSYAPVTNSDDMWLGSRRKSDSRNSLAPSSNDIVGVLAALKKAIDTTDQKDIESACMMAMAKIGQDHPEFRISDVFTSHLDSRNQEIRETAALSMGLAGNASEAEFDLLIRLARGQKE
jgi:hypothetical protein